MAPPTLHEREVFPQIAGHPALDLVNTVSWRLSEQRRLEHLTDFESVIRWSEQVGLLQAGDAAMIRVVAAQDPDGAEREVDRIIALREALYESEFEGSSSEPISREYAAAVAVGSLVRGDQGQPWTWSIPADIAAPRHRIALAALDLLERGDVSHLGRCSDAECGWVYLDSSPRHNRRWCVAADCGNRNRVREYYERSKAAK